MWHWGFCRFGLRNGTNGVEITQASDAPVLWRAGLQVSQHLLHRFPGASVWLDQRDSSGFMGRDSFNESVDCLTIDEDEGVAAMGLYWIFGYGFD